MRIHMGVKTVAYLDIMEYHHVSEREMYINLEEDTKDDLGKTNTIIPHALYIKLMFVDPAYRENGLCKQLYIAFGERYQKHWQGVPVFHAFGNPVAEYTLYQLMMFKLIPSELYVTAHIDRLYYEWRIPTIELIQQKKIQPFNGLPQSYIHYTCEEKCMKIYS